MGLRWKPAERFPGDALSLECDPRAWIGGDRGVVRPRGWAPGGLGIARVGAVSQCRGVRLMWILGWVGLISVLGCRPAETAAPPAISPGPVRAGAAAQATSGPVAAGGAGPRTAASGEPQYHLDHAQPKLATVRLYVGPKQVDAEVCRSITEIATGLMFRSGIGADETMLFVFGRPHRPAFYMKNVPFDISAAYIDSEGVIQEIVALKRMDETSVPSRFDTIQFVLEAAPDFFERNGIGPGTLIRSSAGSLKETFRMR